MLIHYSWFFYFIALLLSLFSCPSCGPLKPGKLHVSNTDCKAVVHQSSFLYLETWFHLYFILFFNICNNTFAFYPVAILNAPYHLAHVCSYHNKIRLICGKKKPIKELLVYTTICNTKSFPHKIQTFIVTSLP